MPKIRIAKGRRAKRLSPRHYAYICARQAGMKALEAWAHVQRAAALWGY